MLVSDAAEEIRRVVSRTHVHADAARRQLDLALQLLRQAEVNMRCLELSAAEPAITNTKVAAKSAEVAAQQLKIFIISRLPEEK